MNSLKTLALAHNPQDAGSTLPPQQHQKFTISYTSAARSGILKKSEQPRILTYNRRSTMDTVTLETNTQKSEGMNN
jgi:hypothetical protein